MLFLAHQLFLAQSVFLTPSAILADICGVFSIPFQLITHIRYTLTLHAHNRLFLLAYYG